MEWKVHRTMTHSGQGFWRYKITGKIFQNFWVVVPLFFWLPRAWKKREKWFEQYYALKRILCAELTTPTPALWIQIVCMEKVNRKNQTQLAPSATESLNFLTFFHALWQLYRKLTKKKWQQKLILHWQSLSFYYPLICS